MTFRSSQLQRSVRLRQDKHERETACFCIAIYTVVHGDGKVKERLLGLPFASHEVSEPLIIRVTGWPEPVVRILCPAHVHP